MRFRPDGRSLRTVDAHRVEAVIGSVQAAGVGQRLSSPIAYTIRPAATVAGTLVTTSPIATVSLRTAGRPRGGARCYALGTVCHNVRSESGDRAGSLDRAAWDWPRS